MTSRIRSILLQLWCTLLLISCASGDPISDVDIESTEQALVGPPTSALFWGLDLLPKLVGAFRGESISLVDLSVRDEEAMKIVLADERIVRYSKDEGSGAEICTIVTKEKMREIYEDLATGLYKWWGVGPHTTGFKYVNVNPESRWFDIDTSEEYASAKKIFETVT